MRLFSNIKLFIPLLVILSTLTLSCRREVEIDSVEKRIFIDSYQIGSYISGRELLVYDPSIHQIAVNSKRSSIRIQNDDQTVFINLRLEAMPKTIGVNILADVYLSVNRKVEEYKVVLECSKIENRQMWLWDRENLLGFIIPFPINTKL